MDKEEKLKIQLEAVNTYIDTLKDCINRKCKESEAYLLTVNIFRDEAGKSLIQKKETLEIFKKFDKYEKNFA